MLDFLRVFGGNKPILPNKDKLLSDKYVLSENRLAYMRSNPSVVNYFFFLAKIMF